MPTRWVNLPVEQTIATMKHMTKCTEFAKLTVEVTEKHFNEVKFNLKLVTDFVVS